MTPSPANPQVLETMSKLFVSLPHCATLGFQYLGTEGRRPVLKVEWREDLVGNPASGTIHGGVITSLVDTTSAVSVTACLPDFETIATLDLRIDYLKAATPGKAIHCRAECYRLASQIAFTRAVCYHDDPADPIAHGVATFMRESSRASMLQEPKP
ncbi:PaaI family thioesterase [Aquitalea sp. ASV11]|uniref:PaaI family thioesterase n=1 Tax=Aquitalea TaxID=407217 RepID=UPI0018EC3EAF|nr:PaaI family thioesterase [Aquitalea sp. ASV11]